MQKENFVVNSGGGVALWRGIPAQITIAGIEDVSGDWLFLVDNDYADGVILSGTVAASGETLVVTLENMNTVELAAAIDGKPTLQCRATLTDGTSRVYILPLTIRNRAVSGTPTPVAEYYTKAQVDALIAGLEPGGTDDYNELDNKPAINSVTLTGNKTAADLGLLSSDGLPIVALESGTIPAPGAVYTLTPSAATEFAFPTPVAGKDNAFRLVLTMPDPAVAVTFPSGLTWKFATPALAAGTISELAFAWTGSSWEGWAVPDMSEYMPKSGGTFTGTITVRGSSTVTGMSIYGSGRTAYFGSYGCALGPASTTTDQFGSFAAGYKCKAGMRDCVYGYSSVSEAVLGYNTVCGTYCTCSVTNKAVYGYANIDPTADQRCVFGCGLDESHRANAWSVKTDKTFVVHQNTVFEGSVTFTPSGGTETTLSSLVARIEALEQAIQ